MTRRLGPRPPYHAARMMAGKNCRKGTFSPRWTKYSGRTSTCSCPHRIVKSTTATCLDTWRRAAPRSSDTTCQTAFIDAGPGIPPEIHEKIFTPFFTTKSRGTLAALPQEQRLPTRVSAICV